MNEGRKEEGSKEGSRKGGRDGRREEGNKEGKKGSGEEGTQSPLCANGYHLNPLRGRLPNSVSVLGLLLGELVFVLLLLFSQ